MRKEGATDLFTPLAFQTGDLSHELKRQLSFTSKLSDALKGPQERSCRKMSLSTGHDVDSLFKMKPSQPSDGLFRNFEMQEWLKNQLEQTVLIEVKEVFLINLQGIRMCLYLKEVYETLKSDQAWDALKTIQQKLKGIS